MSDLRRGIYTLPVIYTFKTEPKTMRPLLEKRAHLTDQEIDTILDCIHRCRGIERARELAKKYTRKALQELDQLPEGKNKATLRKLTLALLERNR
jgi:heptaprenyl diphosphate synthase